LVSWLNLKYANLVPMFSEKQEPKSRIFDE
jgi:hypothetical protein